MDFETWFKQHVPNAPGKYHELLDVWETATKAERERCAALCDSMPENDPKGPWFNDDMSLGARECAAAIRDSHT